MSNTIRVVKQGASASIYLPDGSLLLGVLDVEVKLGGHGEVGKLTITVTDFVVDSTIKPRDTMPQSDMSGPRRS